MQSNKRSQLRRKSGLRIGEKVRALRLDRRWSQAELAKRLGLSQARLSEIERGAGSFTAEQFIELLALFNVTVGHFAPGDASVEAELQNALARLGATHLVTTNATPTDRVRDVNAAVRETLIDGSPRLLTALAPVLVNNSGEVNLRRIEGSLREVGLDHRLGWLVENIAAAIHLDLSGRRPSRQASSRYRRASVLLDAFLETVSPPNRELIGAAPDVLDDDIRSKQTLKEVRDLASPISRRWSIVTRLDTSDFLEALQASDVAV
jgi:transcriptional regulator with XRE-family HTH domain